MFSVESNDGMIMSEGKSAFEIIELEADSVFSNDDLVNIALLSEATSLVQGVKSVRGHIKNAWQNPAGRAVRSDHRFTAVSAGHWHARVGLLSQLAQALDKVDSKSSFRKDFAVSRFEKALDPFGKGVYLTQPGDLTIKTSDGRQFSLILRMVGFIK